MVRKSPGVDEAPVFDNYAPFIDYVAGIVAEDRSLRVPVRYRLETTGKELPSDGVSRPYGFKTIVVRERVGVSAPRPVAVFDDRGSRSVDHKEKFDLDEETADHVSSVRRMVSEQAGILVVHGGRDASKLEMSL